MVTVTDKAIQEIKRVMQEQSLKQEETALRVRVVGGGCSGFSTKLDLDAVWSEEKDNVFMINDIKLAIDKRSFLYLTDTKIDFIEDLNKRGFVVDVPAAKSKCG